MIVRIAYFKELPERAQGANHDSYRQWMAEQPGFVRGHHCSSALTGEATSISYWQSMQHLMDLKSKTPPGGPMGMKPDRVETYEVEHEF
jgi:hypothetical protein